MWTSPAFYADIHEGTEVDHVLDCALENHASFKSAMVSIGGTAVGELIPGSGQAGRGSNNITHCGSPAHSSCATFLGSAL